MGKLATLRIAISSLAMLGALTVGARAYILEGQRWPTTPGAVTYVYIAACLGSTQWELPYPTRIPFQDGVTSWNEEFFLAAADWNQYMASLQLYPYRATAKHGGRFGDGVNEARFAPTAGGQKFDSDTLALTIYYYDSTTNYFSETDIVFNTRFTWNAYRGPLRGNVTDFRRVALHELGHVVGLDDINATTPPALMNLDVSDTDDLTQDDINGVQAQYGAR
jgi:predicted Zn-dependent protease